MSARKVIGYLAGAVTILIGIFFIWGSFSPNGRPSWIIVGLISAGIGIVLLFWAGKGPAQVNQTNVTYKVDLPANVQLEGLKCKSCGGVITPENIQMVAGAPVVTCPYCKTSYQLTEEPKW